MSEFMNPMQVEKDFRNLLLKHQSAFTLIRGAFYPPFSIKDFQQIGSLRLEEVVGKDFLTYVNKNLVSPEDAQLEFVRDVPEVHRKLLKIVKSLVNVHGQYLISQEHLHWLLDLTIENNARDHSFITNYGFYHRKSSFFGKTKEYRILWGELKACYYRKPYFVFLKHDNAEVEIDRKAFEIVAENPEQIFAVENALNEIIEFVKENEWYFPQTLGEKKLIEDIGFVIQKGYIDEEDIRMLHILVDKYGVDTQRADTIIKRYTSFDLTKEQEQYLKEVKHYLEQEGQINEKAMQKLDYLGTRLGLTKEEKEFLQGMAYYYFKKNTNQS